MMMKTQKVILEPTKGFKERNSIEISHVGFDEKHEHFQCKYLQIPICRAIDFVTFMYRPAFELSAKRKPRLAPADLISQMGERAKGSRNILGQKQA